MKKGITIFTALALIAMVVHFSIVLCYSFRDNLPVRITAKADRYCIPLFHQNWKLFAPDLPQYNLELEYRAARFGNWSDWNDASAHFNFQTTSRIETIEQGFNTSLGWQVMNNLYQKEGRTQFDRIVQSNAYASALYFVLKMEEIYHKQEKPDSVQLRLHFRFTPPPDKAYTFQKTYLELPVYALPE
jgi:Family of unknown function (DUF5819)